MTRHSSSLHAAETDSAWLDEMITAVNTRLETRPPESDEDVYVWNDGTITGPPDADPDDDIRVISVFTPGEHPSPTVIRESLLAGLQAIP